LERCSNIQLEQLKALNKQIEARLTRAKNIALTNEWRQRQHMSNYQSEYDRIRNDFKNSALPFQTQEHTKKMKVG
jgi:hypothetical protein